MNQKEFNQHIQKAIAWLATEYYYFKELQADLTRLKADIDASKAKVQVKDIKHALRDFRYIGKAERRLENQEKEIQKAIDQVKKNISIDANLYKIKQISERIEIEANNLVLTSSFYEGKIKDHLTHLRDEIKDHEIEKARKILVDVEETVEYALKWIGTMSIDLRLANKIIFEFEKVGKMSRSQIEEVKKLLSNPIFLEAEPYGGTYYPNSSHSYWHTRYRFVVDSLTTKDRIHKIVPQKVFNDIIILLVVDYCRLSVIDFLKDREDLFHNPLQGGSIMFHEYCEGDDRATGASRDKRWGLYYKTFLKDPSIQKIYKGYNQLREVKDKSQLRTLVAELKEIIDEADRTIRERILTNLK